MGKGVGGWTLPQGNMVVEVGIRTNGVVRREISSLPERPLLNSTNANAETSTRADFRQGPFWSRTPREARRSQCRRGRRAGLAVLTSLEKGRLRTAFGYADWWKLHALVYMMRHPCEAYRTRNLRAHLLQLGLQISSLDFRRFCKRHGIRRDERAGRPRKLG